MKLNSALLVLILFSLSAQAALKPAEKTALDTYLSIRSGTAKDFTSVIVGLQEQVNARITEVEKIYVEEIPELKLKNAELARQNAEADDNIRFINSLNFNFYENPNWTAAMHQQVNKFCCSLRKNPPVKGSRFYTKLQHGGGGNPAAYKNNTLSATGPGLGGAKGGRRGGPRGGGRGGRGRRGGAGAAGGGGKGGGN